MTEVNQTVLRSLREAAGAAGRLIEQCVDQAVAELQAAAGRAVGAQRQPPAAPRRELHAARPRGGPPPRARPRRWGPPPSPRVRRAASGPGPGARAQAEAAPERPSGFA